MDLLKNLDDMMTAEEFLNKDYFYIILDIRESPINPTDISQAMIEFAKLHVEAAKKEYHKVLVKQGVVTDAGIGYFDNVYPLENIK